MNPDICILELPIWPAVIPVRHTAVALGLPESTIPKLIEGKFLRPLGKPGRNGERLFSSYEVRQLMNNPERLNRAVRYIQEYRRQRNQRYGQRRLSINSNGALRPAADMGN